MKNKLLLGFGVAAVVVLSATQAVNYSLKAAMPKAVLAAVELGMDKTTAQAMYDDGVDAKDIKPRFVSAWKKDKLGQVGNANEFKALQARMDNPDLKAAFEVLGSDRVKQALADKQYIAQQKSAGVSNKRAALSLAEIKKMMSNDEFMAYTDMLWHRRTSAALLKLPSNKKNKSGNYQKAATLTVGGGIGCTYSSIAAAVFDASDGDTILVEAKTFTGAAAQFDNQGKSLIIQGGYDSFCQTLDINGNRTVLQSDISGNVVNIDLTGGKSVELFGLDISGAQSDGTDFTSGIHVTSDGGFGNLTIGNTHIHDNDSKFGGGISVTGGALVTINQATEIYANHTTDGGGGIYCLNSFVTADDVKIGRFNGVAQGNDADLNAFGSGLYAVGCEINFGTVSGPVEVSYNSSLIGRSTIDLVSTQMQFNHKDSRISFNQGSNTRVMWVQLSSVLNIEDVKITDNDARILSISDSSFSMKSTCSSSPCAEISRNNGEMTMSSNGFIDMDKVKITDNIADTIISSFNIKNDIAISNSQISGNSADLLFDLVGSSNTLTLDSSTIANNTGANEIFNSINASQVLLQSSILWGNNHSDLQTIGSSGVVVSDSVIQYDPTGMTNTIMQDPLFIDAAANDFHILRNSPAVNRSMSALTDDIDGDPRPSGIGKEAGMDEYSDLVGINGAACEYPTVSMAIAAASAGDTIYISKGTYFEQLGLIDKDLDFVSATDDCSAVDIAATKTDVTIDGNNQFSTSGGLMYINNNSNVSFTNISLTNADADFGGIILLNTGSTLDLNDVNASNGSGILFGGIINTGGNLRLNGDTSIFSGNSTIGGGIYSRGIVEINDTSRIGIEDFGNMGESGGGINCEGGGSLTLNDTSSIYANVAVSIGGGVEASTSTLTLNDNSSIGSGFISLANKSPFGGGLSVGDSAGSSTLTMLGNSKIQNNIASKEAGGVYVSGASLTLTSGEISSNYTDAINPGDLVYGAGMYVVNDFNLPPKDIIISNNFSIMGNKKLNANGVLYGGGIYAKDMGVQITLNSSTVTNNSADFGGGIWLENMANLTINDSEVSNNFALNDAGGIYAADSSITINGNNGGSKIDNNYANFSGGGIYAINSNIDVLGDVSISLNQASSGGGLMLDGTPLHSSTTVAKGMVLNGNTKSTVANPPGGAGIYGISGSHMTLSGAIFSNNSTTGKGGAIYTDISISTFINTQFIQNSADMGGAIYEGELSFVELTAQQDCVLQKTAYNCSRLTGNTATTSGATIVVDAQTNPSQMHMSHTVVHDNTPNAQGNVLLINADSQFRVNDSLFFNNGPQGIVSNDTSRVTLTAVTMVNSGLTLNALHVDSQVDNSIIWNTAINIPAGMPGTCNISPNNELNGSNADPLFVTALEGPYHLAANSPAIDQCADDNGFDVDFRVHNIDSNGVNNPGFETDIGAFERPLFANLIVTKFGMGTVVSDFAGINCGEDCTESYELGKTIQLTATPAAGYVFQKWTGACFDQSSICDVTINGLTETDVIFATEQMFSDGFE